MFYELLVLISEIKKVKIDFKSVYITSNPIYRVDFYRGRIILWKIIQY